MSKAAQQNRMSATLYYYRNREKILERLNTDVAKEKRAAYFREYYAKKRDEINRKRRDKKRVENHRHYCKRQVELKQDDLKTRKTPFLVSFGM